MIPEEYLVVEAKINKEIKNILELKQELTRYGLYPGIQVTRVGGFNLEDEAVARIAGSILHDYYTAAEKIFKTIATKIDKSIPPGEQWHKELLEQMTLSLPGLRPAVISVDTAQKLDPYRGFRHIFRNVYGFNISFTRMRDLLHELPVADKMLQGDLDEFTHKMHHLHGLDEAPPAPTSGKRKRPR